jgi:hypothetical protein
VSRDSPYNRVIDTEWLEIVKNKFCDLPSLQRVSHPIAGELPLNVIIKWSKPPISDIMGENRAISECLYCLPTVYSDRVVLSHTNECVRIIEETLPDIFTSLKLVFHLSKTLDM